MANCLQRWRRAHMKQGIPAPTRTSVEFLGVLPNALVMFEKLATARLIIDSNFKSRQSMASAKCARHFHRKPLENCRELWRRRIVKVALWDFPHDGHLLEWHQAIYETNTNGSLLENLFCGLRVESSVMWFFFSEQRLNVNWKWKLERDFISSDKWKATTL